MRWASKKDRAWRARISLSFANRLESVQLFK
jgi:hypothetical protein